MARVKNITVRVGDTMRSIAHRELGDNFLWLELAQFNRLRPPYLIPSVKAEDRQPNTVIWGDQLKVPLKGASASRATGDDALGQDVRMYSGFLVSESGDLSLINGVENLGQALKHRLLTGYRTYYPHESYGCEMHTLLGIQNGAVTALLGAAFARRAALRDPRVSEANAVGSASVDQLLVHLTAKAVDQETISDTNTIFQLPRL